MKMNRKLYFIIAVLVLCLGLTACAEEEEGVSDVVSVETEVEASGVETSVDLNDCKNVGEENSVEEIFGPQNVKEWAKSIDTTEPQMTIWNSTFKEGIILENGQNYELRQDDQLVFCIKEKHSNISMYTKPNLSSEDFEFRSNDNYVRIQLNKVLTNNTYFEFNLTIADVEYIFEVTLVSEGGSVEPNEEDNLIGKEWAATLDYDEVKLLIWNYDTGKKEVVDINGEAKIEEGDTIAIYCPDRYWVNTILPVSYVTPIEICGGLCPLPGYKCTLLEEISYEQKGSLDLEVEVTTESEYEYYNFVVTIQ